MDEALYLQTTRRLENWGRWCNGGSGGQTRCGSIEGRYVPVREDEERLVRSASVPVDVLDAEVVEATVRALDAPRMRALLRWKFVDGYGKEDICRLLKIRPEMFLASLQTSVNEIAARLAQAVEPRRRRWA